MFWLLSSSSGWLRSWRRGSQTSQMSPLGRMSLRSSARLQLSRKCLSHHFLFPRYYLVLAAQYVKSTGQVRRCNSAWIIWMWVWFSRRHKWNIFLAVHSLKLFGSTHSCRKDGRCSPEKQTTAFHLKKQQFVFLLSGWGCAGRTQDEDMILLKGHWDFSGVWRRQDMESSLLVLKLLFLRLKAGSECFPLRLSNSNSPLAGRTNCFSHSWVEVSGSEASTFNE